MDLMLMGSLVSFFGLIFAWLALPASKETAIEPTRVAIPRRSAAEA